MAKPAYRCGKRDKTTLWNVLGDAGADPGPLAFVDGGPVGLTTVKEKGSELS